VKVRVIVIWKDGVKKRQFKKKADLHIFYQREVFFLFFFFSPPGGKEPEKNGKREGGEVGNNPRGEEGREVW
jgi:hypothetical protein